MQENTAIQASFILSAPDILSTQQHIMLRRFWPVYPIAAAFLAMWIYGLIAMPPLRANLDVMLVAVLVVSALPFLSPRLTASKTLQQPSLQGLHRWSLSSAGIVINAETFQTLGNWSQYVRIEETTSVFLFFLAGNLLSILPKRAVDEDDLPRLRDLIRRSVSQRTKVKLLGR